MKIHVKIASELAAQGKTISEIAEAIGYSYQGTLHVLNRCKIPYKRMPPGPVARPRVPRTTNAAANAAVRNERNQTILNLHLEGVKHPEIAARFGVTRERIRQVVKKFGAKSRAAQNEEYFSALADKIKNAAETMFGFEAIAKSFGVSAQVVRNTAQRHGIEIKPNTISNVRREQINRAIELVAGGRSIRSAVHEVGLHRTCEYIVGTECRALGLKSQHGRWNRDPATLFKNRIKVRAVREPKPRKIREPKPRKIREPKPRKIRELKPPVVLPDGRSVRQACIELREKHSASEIAAALGITRNAVIGHWYRARQLGASQ